MEPVVWVVVIVALLAAYVAFQVFRMKTSFESRGGSYENITSWIKGFLPGWMK